VAAVLSYTWAAALLGGGAFSAKSGCPVGLRVCDDLRPALTASFPACDSPATHPTQLTHGRDGACSSFCAHDQVHASVPMTRFIHGQVVIMLQHQQLTRTAAHSPSQPPNRTLFSPRAGTHSSKPSHGTTSNTHRRHPAGSGDRAAVHPRHDAAAGDRGALRLCV
jgi:hypothetical protein